MGIMEDDNDKGDDENELPPEDISDYLTLKKLPMMSMKMTIKKSKKSLKVQVATLAKTRLSLRSPKSKILNRWTNWRIQKLRTKAKKCQIMRKTKTQRMKMKE